MGSHCSSNLRNQKTCLRRFAPPIACLSTSQDSAAEALLLAKSFSQSKLQELIVRTPFGRCSGDIDFSKTMKFVIKRIHLASL